MKLLTVNEITAGYGRKNIIEKISFELESGCLMGVLGVNGCGKTTLLKAICGILPHDGFCTMEQEKLEDLSPRQIARKIRYIPQRSGIGIDISALDVVRMGFNPQLGLLQNPTPSMTKAAMEALQQVGLSGKEHVNYLHLSEGQKQLCILARTLVSDSRLLLLDEPESALDFRFRYQMLSLLKNWVSAGPRGALVALHDPSLALNFCDRLLLLEDGHILGMAEPNREPLAQTERKLSRIYGGISLQFCQPRKGSPQIVMLKEDET